MEPGILVIVSTRGSRVQIIREVGVPDLEPPNEAHNHKCPDCGKVWGCEDATDKADWEVLCAKCLEELRSLDDVDSENI